MIQRLSTLIASTLTLRLQIQNSTQRGGLSRGEVSILAGETAENAGKPQGSPLHVGFHKDVGETLAVSLFPQEGGRPSDQETKTVLYSVGQLLFPDHRKEGIKDLVYHYHHLAYYRYHHRYSALLEERK